MFEQNFPDQRNDIDWMRWHADLESKAPPLKSLLPDCPAALSDLLESMMEKHVEKRPTDLNEILGRLRSVAQRANKTVVLQRPAALSGSGSGAAMRQRSNEKQTGSIRFCFCSWSVAWDGWGTGFGRIRTS